MKYFLRGNDLPGPLCLFRYKLQLIMRLTIMLILALSLGANASGLAQKITLSVTNVSLEELFAQIRKQSDYEFLYNDELVQQFSPVTLHVKNAGIEEVLDKSLAGKPLTYRLIAGTITILPREDHAEKQQALPVDRSQNVTGTVTDTTGVPLSGVSVTVKSDPSVGAATDMNGKFSLNVPEDAVLVFSYMGFETLEVPVDGRAVIDVVLRVSETMLDELVVVGYGTQKKENLTGAVSQISSEVLENRSVTSVSQALQGTMAGVSVQQTEGRPGANANIRIRGFSSLNSGGALVIIDGTPGDLNSLNPEDVESITVLKDAASAAIYGARAAEGVILVRTKTGNPGAFNIRYRGSVSVLTPTRFPEQAHSYDGAVLANLAAQNAGANPFYSKEMIEAMRDPSVTAIPQADGAEWDYVADFDWADYFLKTSVYQNHNVSISGGGKRSEYYISASWLDQNGYFSEHGPDNFDRYNLRVNMANELVPEKLKFDLRLGFTNSKTVQSSKGTGYLMQSVLKAGRSMPLYNPNGTYARYRMQQNAMQLLKESGFDEDRSNRFEGRASLNWTALPGLHIKGLIGYNLDLDRGTLFGRGYYKYHPGMPPDRFGWVNQPNRVNIGESYSRYYTSQVVADYTRSVNQHHFKIMAGGAVEENSYEHSDVTRFNIFGNELPALNLGDTEDMQSNYNGYEWGLLSGFGRFNYDFAGKYLFEANFRADASSRFSEENRWGFFPSFSAGWRLSEESFVKALNIFSNLKIRASYGEVGNQNGLGYYDHIRVYQFASSLIPFPSGDAQHVFNPRLPSQSRSWETVTNSNLGLELGFLNNQLTFEGDIYIKRNKDMLINIEVPSLIGIQVPTNNYGELETKGWEISLNWRGSFGKEPFNYSVGFNLYDQKDEIVSLNREFTGLTAGIRNLQGYPVNSIFGYETAGYFQTAAEVEDWAFQHARTGPGDIKYIDQDGDGKISQPNDLRYLGSTTPRYGFGMNLRANYRNFDFSMIIQGVGKRNFYLSGFSVQPYFNTWDNHSLAIHQDHWSTENPDALFPRPVSGASWNYQSSQHWMQNASYIRIKHLQLGYTIPTGDMKIKQVRVYFSAENLWEATDLIMFDPEINNTNAHLAYPLNRHYTFGLNLLF